VDNADNGNGRLERRVRFLVLFAAAVATVVLFAWRSQAKQDERISRNERGVAVINAKLDVMIEMIDEVRGILMAPRADTKRASWREDGEGGE